MLEQKSRAIESREQEPKDWRTAYMADADNFYDTMMEEGY